MHDRSTGLRRLLSVVVLVATVVLAVPAPAGATTDIGSPLRQDGAADEPLEPADRDVLHKVKQAGL